MLGEVSMFESKLLFWWSSNFFCVLLDFTAMIRPAMSFIVSNRSIGCWFCGIVQLWTLPACLSTTSSYPRGTFSWWSISSGSRFSGHPKAEFVGLRWSNGNGQQRKVVCSMEKPNWGRRTDSLFIKSVTIKFEVNERWGLLCYNNTWSCNMLNDRRIRRPQVPNITINCELGRHGSQWQGW